MRPIQDKDLLWIAECALTAPVPGERIPPIGGCINTYHSVRGCACWAFSDGWEEYLDEDGDVFYYECNGGKSTYEHPCDAYFKWMYTVLRQQSMVRLRALWLVTTCSVGLTYDSTLQTMIQSACNTGRAMCNPHLSVYQAARRIQRFYKRRLQRLRVERRMVRQTVRAIHLPAYTPPRRLEEV